MTGIGSHYNKTGAAISLRWLKEHGIPLSTKATNPTYLKENLDAVAGTWSLDKADPRRSTARLRRKEARRSSVSRELRRVAWRARRLTISRRGWRHAPPGA